MKILVVEDELSLREGLLDLLAGDGHDVDVAADGRTGLELGTATRYDLVVLDVMLPRLDGVEVCRRLRAARPGLAILMLTARAAEDDKIRGLIEGDDDYMTKPFSPRELLARVRVLGRRHQEADSDELSADGVVFELGRLIARRGEHEIPLTAREAGILRLLYRSRGRAVSRSELLESVWGARGDLETRAVDMAIAALRKKIEITAAEPRIVLTVKGAGYMWGGEVC